MKKSEQLHHSNFKQRGTVNITYETTYKESIEKRGEFWSEAAERIDWYKEWDHVLDESNAPLNR